MKTMSFSCDSCKTSFGPDGDRFIDHMTDTHSDDAICCTICRNISNSGIEYAIHYLDNHHSDGGGGRRKGESSSGGSRPSITPAPPVSSVVPITCPICIFQSANSDEVQKHFDSVHEVEKEKESPPAPPACPICDFRLSSEYQLTLHVNSHFENGNGRAEVASEEDYQLALSLQKEENDKKKKQENAELQALQEQYGMSERGSYRSQGRTNLDRQYFNGQIDLNQYYTRLRQLDLHVTAGMEDPNMPLTGILEAITKLSIMSLDVAESRTCIPLQHCSSGQADTGFGCGYRNIQMILSSLKSLPSYKQKLWGNDDECHIPSVPKLQELIEVAWEKGFDHVGKNQLNGRIRGTRKWIGATETAAFFNSYKIRFVVSLKHFEKCDGMFKTEQKLFMSAWYVR